MDVILEVFTLACLVVTLFFTWRTIVATRRTMAAVRRTNAACDRMEAIHRALDAADALRKPPRDPGRIAKY